MCQHHGPKHRGQDLQANRFAAWTRELGLRIVRPEDIVIVDETSISSAQEDHGRNRTHIGPASFMDANKLSCVMEKSTDIHATHVAGFTANGKRLPYVFITPKQVYPRVSLN